MTIRGKRQGHFKAGAAERQSCFFSVGRNGKREDTLACPRAVRDCVRHLNAEHVQTDEGDGLYQWIDWYRCPLVGGMDAYPRVCGALRHAGLGSPSWGVKATGRCPHIQVVGVGAGEDSRRDKALSRYKAIDKAVQSRENKILPCLNSLFPGGIPWKELHAVPLAKDRGDCVNMDSFNREFYLPSSWLLEEEGYSLRASWSEMRKFVGFEQAYFLIEEKWLAAGRAGDESEAYWQGRQQMLLQWCREEILGMHDNLPDGPAIGRGIKETYGVPVRPAVLEALSRCPTCGKASRCNHERKDLS